MMEETMRWCPCQLAMKNNYTETDELIELYCYTIRFGLQIEKDYNENDALNWYVDHGIQYFCKKHCAYYNALLNSIQNIQ